MQEDGAGHELEKVKAPGEAQRNSNDSAKIEKAKGFMCVSELRQLLVYGSLFFYTLGDETVKEKKKKEIMGEFTCDAELNVLKK